MNLVFAQFEMNTIQIEALRLLSIAVNLFSRCRCPLSFCSTTIKSARKHCMQSVLDSVQLSDVCFEFEYINGNIEGVECLNEEYMWFQRLFWKLIQLDQETKD